MAFINSADKIALEARLVRKQALLTAAYDQMDALLANDIDSYSLDTGEGKQAAKKKSTQSLLEAIDILERQIQQLVNRLRGLGVVKMNVRRRTRC